MSQAKTATITSFSCGYEYGYNVSGRFGSDYDVQRAVQSADCVVGFNLCKILREAKVPLELIRGRRFIDLGVAFKLRYDTRKPTIENAASVALFDNSTFDMINRATRQYQHARRVPVDVLDSCCEAHYNVCNRLCDKLLADRQTVQDIEAQFTGVLAMIEASKLATMKERAREDYTRKRLGRTALEAICAKVGGESFNPRNNSEVVSWMVSRGHEPVWIEGHAKLDGNTLRLYGIPLLDAVADLRDNDSACAWLSMFEFNDGFTHTYDQLTATGRTSSNIHPMPKWARAYITPQEGNKFISIDYRQIQLCIIAELIGDETAIDYINRGDSGHQLTAERFNVDYDRAKAANYMIAFGAGDRAVARVLGDEAVTRVRGEFMPGLNATRRNYRRKCIDDGYSVTTSGRRRWLGVDDAWLAFTSVVQGTEADIVKRSVAKFVDALPDDVRPVAFMHDELLLEAPVDADVDALLPLLTETATLSRVALSVAVGESTWHWREAQDSATVRQIEPGRAKAGQPVSDVESR